MCECVECLRLLPPRSTFRGAIASAGSSDESASAPVVSGGSLNTQHPKRGWGGRKGAAERKTGEM
eukprot:6203381-Pleurochrysis_carterae.AAC.1